MLLLIPTSQVTVSLVCVTRSPLRSCSETPVWTKFETAKDGDCLDAAVAPCQRMGQVFNTIDAGPSLVLQTLFERKDARPNHNYNWTEALPELLTLVYNGSLSASSSVKDAYDALEVDRFWYDRSKEVS
eukprot:355236-Chlamydomonas_euryale.AAC.5